MTGVPTPPTDVEVIPPKNKGGRPVGTGHRTNIGPLRLLAKIQDRLKRKAIKGGEDYDPVVAMAEIATNQNNPVEVRLMAHSKVAKFVHAEVKPIEVDPENSATGAIINAKVQVLDVILSQLERK